MQSKGVNASEGEFRKRERDRISEVRQKWVQEKSRWYREGVKRRGGRLEEDSKQRKRRVGSTSSVFPKENHEDFTTTSQRRPSRISLPSDGLQHLSTRVGGQTGF